MADYEMKDNSFSLFKNDKKTEDNHPDYTGKIRIDGRELRLAAWVKSKDGKAFFSGKVSEFQQRTEQSGPVEDPINPTASADPAPAVRGRKASAPVEETDTEPLPF